MSDDRRLDPRQLPLPLAAEVDRVCDGFAAAWAAGRRPRAEDYLTGAAATLRAPLLAELLRVELEARLAAGEAPTPAEFRGRFPGATAAVYAAFQATTVPAPAHVAPAGTHQRLGDYAILRELGRGGMGIVYEAERESLKVRVALKVMHPRFRADPNSLRRFRTEARSAARLHHTNIVSVFDFGEQDGVCYYAMQYIAGVGLHDVLDDVRRLRAAADGASRAGTGGKGDDRPTEPVDGTRSAVSRGLLTGRFATAPVDPGGSDRPPTVALDPDQTGPVAPVNAPERPASVPPSAAPPGDGGSGTSSFAGQPEFVYFREIARLGAQVADALDHAHRQNVIHRDIKPSNLLLDPQGNVWVTDFGLAKLVEGDDLSQSHDLVGTLRFMAPERFRGVTDRRGDIYALGATLYEMLALQPAFGERDQIQLIDQIVHQAPAPLRQHDRRIPRDLETIVLKAMAKDPKDRCDKAGELRDELRRFLEGRPTRWRQVGPVEQFRRWCKRNPWLAAANIAAAVLTTLLAIGSTIAAWIYSAQVEALQLEQRKTKLAHQGLAAQLVQTLKAETQGRERVFESLVSQAQARRVSRRMGQRFETLDALRQAADIGRDLKLPSEKFDSLRAEAIACLALPDLKPAGRVITQTPNVINFAFDSTMTRYALRFRDGTISVRRVADDQEIARFEARGDRDIVIFGFSPDGRYLATMNVPGDALTVWDVDRRSVALNDQAGVAGAAAKFSPDSRAIAVSHRDGEFVIYDLATGMPRCRWRGLTPSDPQFSPDGTQIAVIEHGGKKDTCQILDAQSGRLIRSFEVLPGESDHPWSPDGATLAMPCNDMKIYLWDAATGTRRATLEGHINYGLRATFHPAGTLLASNGWEGRLWLWDPVLGRPWLTLTSYSYPEFSRDGRIVLSREGTWAPYQVDPALEYRTFAHVSSKLTGCYESSIRCDGRVLAVGTKHGVALWDLARGTELAFLRIGLAWHLRFEPSGDLLTNGSLGVRRWPIRLDRDRGECRIGPPRPLPLPPGDCEIAEDRSGRIVAVADHDRVLVATPERTIRVGPLDDCRSVAVSPDGEWLATGTHVSSHGAQVWRVRDGTKLAELPIDYGTAVSFSPDGKWLMTTNLPCRLWEVGTWREAPLKIGGAGKCFSPDGRLVVVQDASRIIRLVESETGRTLAQLESPDLCAVEMATFSPDGARLVVTTHDGPAVHVWDLRAIRRHLAGMGLDWDAPAYSDDDPADPSASPFPQIKVDYGPLPLSGHPAIIEGGELAKRGRWDEAAAAFARAFADGSPAEAYLCFEHAVLRLAVGDADGYRATCQTMLVSLGSTNDPDWLEFTAHACALASGRTSRAEETVRLAERRRNKLKTAWSDHVLGLSFYRAGRFAEAVAVLTAGLQRGADRDEVYVLHWLVLAMAHCKLGQPDEARRWLRQAERWVEARLRDRPGGPDHAIPDRWLFRDGIIMHLLLREARALLDGPPHDLPADVFAPGHGSPVRDRSG